MHVFTQAVWKVIAADEYLLRELAAMLRQQQQQPFLNEEQAFQATTTMLKAHMLEKFKKWLDWLPTLPTEQIGAVLAEEAMKCVEWDDIANQIHPQTRFSTARRTYVPSRR